MIRRLLRAVLCAVGRHDWEDMGLASYGRGRLERCRRGCTAVRAVALSDAALERVLDYEVARVKSKARREPEAYAAVEADLASMDDETTPLPIFELSDDDSNEGTVPLSGDFEV